MVVAESFCGAVAAGLSGRTGGRVAGRFRRSSRVRTPPKHGDQQHRPHEFLFHRSPPNVSQKPGFFRETRFLGASQPARQPRAAGGQLLIFFRSRPPGQPAKPAGPAPATGRIRMPPSARSSVTRSPMSISARRVGRDLEAAGPVDDHKLFVDVRRCRRRALRQGRLHSLH